MPSFNNFNSRHAVLTFSTDFIVRCRHNAVAILTVSTVFDIVLPGWSSSCMLGTKRILLIYISINSNT